METVLIVEGDAASIDQLGVLLREKTHTVLEATCGYEAIRVCQEHAAPIHLLITHVADGIPGGRELADYLRGSHPEMRVLFVGSQPRASLVRAGRIQKRCAYLRKPIARETLEKTVSKLLGKTSRPAVRSAS